MNRGRVLPFPLILTQSPALTFLLRASSPIPEQPTLFVVAVELNAARLEYLFDKSLWLSFGEDEGLLSLSFHEDVPPRLLEASPTTCRTLASPSARAFEELQRPGRTYAAVRGIPNLPNPFVVERVDLHVNHQGVSWTLHLARGLEVQSAVLPGFLLDSLWDGHADLCRRRQRGRRRR